MHDIREIKVGYAPYCADLSAPGDRRRFAFYARRRSIDFEIVRPGASYDLVVVSARGDIARWSRAQRSTKVVYDIVDSYLAEPLWTPKNLLRGTMKFLSREIDRPVVHYRKAIEAMCRRADAVICATRAQQATCQTLNPEVHIVLDSQSEMGGPPKSDFGTGDTVHLVWEGLPENIRAFRTIGPILAQLGEERPIALHLVTNKRGRRFMGRLGWIDSAAEIGRWFPNASIHEWDIATFATLVTKCDIAIIPLDPSDPLSYGKPANKLFGFWRLGLPSIVSNSPEYARAMASAGTPELGCSTPDDWARSLRSLIDHEDRRRAAASAGRRVASAAIDDDVLLEGWDRIIRSVIDGSDGY